MHEGFGPSRQLSGSGSFALLCNHAFVLITPSCVNLIAFAIRFRVTYCTRCLSASMYLLCSDLSTSRNISRLLVKACARSTCVTSSIALETSIFTIFGVNTPCWICVRSKLSLTLFSSKMQENFIVSRCFRRSKFCSLLIR